MCMRRVEMQRLQELVRLHRMGTGAREVARMLHMSPNTERDYRNALRAEGLLEGAVEEIAAPEVLRSGGRTPPAGRCNGCGQRFPRARRCRLPKAFSFSSCPSRRRPARDDSTQPTPHDNSRRQYRMTSKVFCSIVELGRARRTLALVLCPDREAE